MTKILFVSNPSTQCGINEFGKNIAALMARSTKLEVIYQAMPEQTAPEQFYEVVRRLDPRVIFYNYHPLIMGWLNDDVLAQLERDAPEIKHIGFAHDETPSLPHLHAIVHLDPTMTPTRREFVVGRPLPRFTPQREPLANVIGSFGLGAAYKGFHLVVDRVNAEFERATIRLHMPFRHYEDPNGHEARRIADECRRRAKPGITVEVSHDFKSKDELLEWLSENTLNCFFYDRQDGAGVSSVLDLALPARRPIALTDSWMFRHVTRRCPEVLIENRSLRSIIEGGFAPLEPFCREWSEDNLRERLEEIVSTVLRRPPVDLTSNRVLTPADRETLRPAVDELTHLCPDIMSRKYPGAVFQNAFIFEQVKRYASRSDRIMLIGGYEDPIGPALRDLGFNVTITDPQVDGKNAHAVWCDAIRSGQRFEIVVSCSVIEHVADDARFVVQLYHLLKPGGVALLTTDFRADWKPDMRPPIADSRLYSPERLLWLAANLPDGALLHAPTWAPYEPYFDFDGVRYGFCSLAFRKPLRLAAGDDIATGLLSQVLREAEHKQSHATHHLRRQLERYQDVKQCGPLTLRLVGRMHGLASRTHVKRPLKALVNLARGFWRRAGRKDKQPA